MRIPEGQISISGRGLLLCSGGPQLGLCWALQELLPTQPPIRQEGAGGQEGQVTGVQLRVF